MKYMKYRIISHGNSHIPQYRTWYWPFWNGVESVTNGQDVFWDRSFTTYYDAVASIVEHHKRRIHSPDPIIVTDISPNNYLGA
jgi:hypothetical protein